MNRPIRNCAVGCLLLFLALLANATYVQYWQADDLTSLSQHPDNIRVRDAEFSRERGSILVRGRAVAQSNPSDDSYQFQREYPQAARYAHLTGYFTRDFGLGGVEATQNSILSGSDSKLFVNRVVDLADNETPKGGSVTLTIDPQAQQAAYDGLRALGDSVQGAVVAIEPRTGKILAMVSNPTFNPNRLASHDFQAAGRYKDQLLSSGGASPLNNKAIEEVLPPGSTFKLVTAAAALESGDYDPDTQVPGGARLDLPQTSTDLVNESGGSCGGDTITLTRALEVSCNVSFGAVGLDLGADALRTQAEKFGFGTRTFEDLDDALTRQAVSRFPEDPDKPQTALSAIGQFDVAATPLQMAMVTAGIANDGTVMKPYLVDETLSPKLETLEKTEPESMPDQPAMSSSAARDLRQMMVSVVDQGTGTTAQIPGVQVGGKTGTAQSSPERPPYAWFVSFAPAETPSVAVAVLVQDAGVERDQISGSGLAAPIAKSVMEAVIGR
ncbi:cell elongation-specific peptidoglycan D,D-transpeptidase [Nocardioides scoriae]|uniref:Cell elongation-specific peptidoglycan D,D-transpeptidase n=1 Tax=Nocardioides scoriae TaxID=642780 RepID=A0A1H1VP21_9ACTN|nr:penicillin-binding protein 2 [Nocardioides scoriae]SDS86151.1 cell elongation-specific peptidoglycan D,D-transpeptidase [Nocardioides scoriae]